ncbi:MAG: hypothetical protein ACOZNI_10105 [Myxococcota bacterium]
MSRAADGALALLLALALAQAVALALRPGPAARAGVPLGSVAALGETITVEDLARGTLALEEGHLPGAAPLFAGERDRARALFARAAAQRDELLRIEGEIAAAEARLGDDARAIAATLTPEQRAWVVAQRDRVSVGQVERAYWDALLAALEE